MLESFANFDALPIGLAAIDARLTVRGWNATLAGWSRTPVSSAVGKRLPELFPEFCEKKYESRLRAVFEQGQTAVFSVKIHERFLPLVQTSGRPLFHKVRISPLEDEPGVALVVIEDVTHSVEQLSELRQERRRLRATETSLREQKAALKEANQELTESRRRAEEANEAKSVFLANMSHEIRTPLTAINGFAQIACDYTTDPFVLDAAKRVLRNGEHLLMVVNDILDLSKIEAGRLEVELSACDPADIVREVAEDLADQAREKGLRLDVEIDDDQELTVVADTMRMRQVLFNLIGNAVKFTKEGGVKVAVRRREQSVELTVNDTGIGIDPEKLDTVFDSFTQADAGTQRRHGGSGLGLAISQRLTRLMHGCLRVESSLARGSTFTVSLPSTEDTPPLASDPVQPSAYEPTSDALSPLEGLRVVVAEDGPDNQKLIEFLLTRAGATVGIFENGKLALDAVIRGGNEAPVDLVILDMQMPVMDGYSAAAALRHVGYGGPILALTAHAMEPDRKKALDAGCDVYAAKPIDADRFVEVCQGMVHNAAAAPV